MMNNMYDTQSNIELSEAIDRIAHKATKSEEINTAEVIDVQEHEETTINDLIAATEDSEELIEQRRRVRAYTKELVNNINDIYKEDIKTPVVKAKPIRYFSISSKHTLDIDNTVLCPKLITRFGVGFKSKYLRQLNHTLLNTNEDDTDTLLELIALSDTVFTTEGSLRIRSNIFKSKTSILNIVNVLNTFFNTNKRILDSMIITLNGTYQELVKERENKSTDTSVEDTK